MATEQTKMVKPQAGRNRRNLRFVPHVRPALADPRIEVQRTRKLDVTTDKEAGEGQRRVDLVPESLADVLDVMRATRGGDESQLMDDQQPVARPERAAGAPGSEAIPMRGKGTTPAVVALMVPPRMGALILLDIDHHQAGLYAARGNQPGHSAGI